MAGAVEPQRLSAADASNVEMDSPDQVNVFLLAGILGAGGFVSDDGTPDLDALRVALEERIDAVPSDATAGLRRRVRRLGGDLVWEACRPDLAWHIRMAEPVQGTTGLGELAARQMTQPLPRDRPMWELLVVPGAGSPGPGIVFRLHHSVADGVAAVALVQELFGGAPVADPRRPDRQARPRTEPPHTSHRSRLRSVVTGMRRVTAVFRATVPPTVLLGPIGPRRGVAFAEVGLEDVARAAKAVGATVNDALLAAVAVGAEAALREAGQSVPAVLPASVPVALPARGTSGNAVGVMMVPLATGQDDPVVRLREIAAVTRAARAEARTQGTFELTRTRWGSRAFAWLARRQRFIALFVTNVRGPAAPMRVAGAPLLQAWPVAPIQGNVRLGVAAMSYAGRLFVTVHTDAEAVDAAVTARAIEAELVRITTGSRPPPGAPS